MSKLYHERLEEYEKNPINQLMREVTEYIRNQFLYVENEDDPGSFFMSEDSIYFDYLMSGPISLPMFAQYLVFETVAQDIRDKQTNSTFPLHKYITNLRENSPDDPVVGKADKAEAAYKDFLRDLNLRKDFLHAAILRSKAPWSDELKWMQTMNKRENFRKGYSLTHLQLEQLHDRYDLNIKKVHELRRFINPKHAPSADVKAYYSGLVQHAQKCQQEADPQKRVIHAINLNDYESRNPAFFLAKAAEHCVKAGITKIDTQTERLLVELTANISLPHNNGLVAHKPVLFIDKYIDAAFNHDTEEIKRYLILTLFGAYLRQEIIPHMLKKYQYTYEDFDKFIMSFPTFLSYNVFGIYSEPNWDEKGKIISTLRELIGKITVDPLST